ncbi:MAG TPA: hypothetical protein PK369_05315 [Thermoclostridium sp.]|nr:hypothetical protein [Clostridiaceae bacterium]HOQ75974.1 hypothetical protein [Thermoclostridium sp.]
MKWLRSEKGSSSVLVALVLIVLVVFSVLAVTTSMANLRLARKNADTVKAFYTLDSEGERFMNVIYNSIILSRDKASYAVQSIRDGDLPSAGLPDAISEIIEATLGSLSGTNSRNEYLDGLYPKLVTYFAMNSIMEAYPGCVYSKDADYTRNFHIYSNVPTELGFSVRKTFILEYENTLRYLNVDVDIENPGNGRELEEVCRILEWRLWQEPFEYRNEIDLWEGIPE